MCAGVLSNFYKVDFNLFSAYYDTIPELSQRLIFAYGCPIFIRYTPLVLRYIQHRFLG